MAKDEHDPIDLFHAMLMSAASDIDLFAEDKPDLTQSQFRGADDSEAGRLDAADLPARARAMKAGRYAVLVGALPDEASAERVKETVRRYRNQCVVARSYLTPNEALDLQLFLVGPRGSERMDEWRPLALSVERDDRVARKLIWLRPTDPKADAESFNDFLKRSFLARPWVHDDALFSAAPLDTLTRLSGLADDKAPRDMIDEWVDLALSEQDPDRIASGLVDAWQRRGAS